MRTATKKLTTAAACTAIAVIMCACTAYLPFSFMPLYVAAFSIFLACKRAGLPYGVLCALATIGVMFAMSGLSVSWFLLLIMFAPYGVFAYFMHRFTYTNVKSGLIRGLSAVAFFNLTAGLTYLVAIKVVAIGLDIPITDWINTLGGYPVFAVVATLVLVPLDVIFTLASSIVLKRIPSFDKKTKASEKSNNNEQTNERNDATEQNIKNTKTQNDVQAEVKYDIFGYEILNDENGQGSNDGSNDTNNENSN